MCWQGNFKFSCRDFRVIKKVLKAPYLYFCGLPRFLNDTKGKIINFQFSKPDLLNLTCQFDLILTTSLPFDPKIQLRFDRLPWFYFIYPQNLTPEFGAQIRPRMIERVNSSPGLLFGLMIGVEKKQAGILSVNKTHFVTESYWKIQMHNGYINDTLSALKLWIRERILLRRVTI